MAFILENEFVKLECVEKGGEIKHLIDKTKGIELIYQGDEGWSGSNPTLFPMVGSTWDGGKYTIHGKEYKMKNHGLIRYATLKGVQNEDSLVFTLEADEASLAQYPFDFKYEIKYTLDGKKVHIQYTIDNKNDEVMPFSFGLHPGFKTNSKEGETFEDFVLSYEKEEVATQYVFDADCIKPIEYIKTPLTDWKLSRDDINKYATIVYKDFESTYVTLSVKGEDRIRVHFPEFPVLALWSFPAVPSQFICIEPWYGHSDWTKEYDTFYDREGTTNLAARETFTTGYDIEIM